MANRVGAQPGRVNGSGTVLTADGRVKRDVPTEFEDVLKHTEVDDDGVAEGPAAKPARKDN